MRICPKCQTAYPTRGRATCAKDGTRLIEAEEFAAAKNDPMLGKNLTGRFAIVERIGIGGMGTVYRAEQANLDRPVALKVLKKELIADEETVARFHREAKAMSMLMHPNTVRVFDFGEDAEGHLFLAMELLEGELLTAFIEREGSPPILEAIETTQQILRSLSEAHSKGLVHRDLKPDNIMLTHVEGHPDAVVKVLDFGIAKVFRDEERIDQLETQAGTVFGTPRYMSPEQAQGKDLDHRSDLYSVGVLLYQMLTGRPPFVDDDAVVVMAKHIREEPEPVRHVAPDRPIPRSLDRIVSRALGKEPEDRFSTADEFDVALEEAKPDVALEEERFASGRPSAMMEAVRDLPRVPLIIGAALIAFAISGAVGIVAFSDPPDPTEPVALEGDLPTVAGPATTEVPEPTTTPRTEVTLRTEPSEAEVYGEDDAYLGTGIVTVDISDGPLRVHVRYPGYERHELEVNADSDPTVHVTLEPEAETGPETDSVATQRRRRRPNRRGQSEPDEGEAPQPPPSSEEPYGRFD